MRRLNKKGILGGESDIYWYGDSLPMRLLLSYCRSVPTFRGKGRIYFWVSSFFFHKELKLRNNNGARLLIDSTDYICRQVAFEGGYEPKSLALAAKIMGRGGVFVDIGCNIGLYTVSVGIIPGVHCIAIDASFVALTKLANNLRRNPSIKATAVSCALGAEDTLHCFETPVPNNLGTTRIVADINKESSSRFLVAGMFLQRVLEQLAPEKIKLLKIDVEGSELSVLTGLDFCGKYRPDNLLVECDPEGFDKAAACFEFLISKGYRAMSIEGNPVRSCLDLPEKNVWFRDSLNAGDRTAPYETALFSLE